MDFVSQFDSDEIGVFGILFPLLRQNNMPFAPESIGICITLRCDLMQMTS